MNETISTPATSETPAKRRGSKLQPPRQEFHVRPSHRLKQATEQFKRLACATRLTPEEKSMLAYFTVPLGRNES